MNLQERAPSSSSRIRIAAVGDLHCTAESRGQFEGLFAQMASAADLLLLCGDLTHNGLPEEARVLAEEIRGAQPRPVVAVLGNHDFESDRPSEIQGILADSGIKMLDGDTFEVAGVGVAGVKGFMGGFERHMLHGWGEPAIKQIVRETMEESVKLESGLAKLKSAHRLEYALGHHDLAAVFHGHAHFGSPQGKTRNGIAVYNVAMPLLERLDAHRPPFVHLDIPAEVNRGK
jgi:predicted phosphodiesterase